MSPGLLPLSLQRVTGLRRVPATPTNDDRVRAFRAYAPPVLGNDFDWAALREARKGRQYAAAETLDGAVPSTERYTEEA